MIHRLMLVAVGVAAGSLVSFESPHAQGEELDRTPQDCVSLSRVRSTTVLDDRTILFYMRNRDEVYLNELPRECPRLERSERFSYQSRTGRLCEVDLITVMESFGGRFQRGATCRLGAFAPITRAEATELVAGPEGARESEEVGVEEVELPDEEDSGSDASGEAGGGEGEGRPADDEAGSGEGEGRPAGDGDDG